MAVENNNIDMDQSQVPQKRENNEAVSKKEVKKSREALEVSRNEALAETNQVIAASMHDHRKLYSEIFLGILIVVLVIVIFNLLSAMVKRFSDGYSKDFQDAKASASSEAYDNAYDQARENYKITNTVKINIGNLRDEQKLEVYEVNASSLQQSEDKEAIVLFNGSSVFTVDMRSAEYLVDNAHQKVTIRIPKPEVSQNVSFTDYEIVYLKDKGFIGRIVDNLTDSAVGVGEDKALAMTKSASEDMRTKIVNNQEYYAQAVTSAKNFLSDSVKALNPDIPNLQVEIVIMD